MTSGSQGRPVVSSTVPVMIDSHCHLADTAFVEDLDAVVARAQAAGVVSAVCILSADDPEEMARVAAVKAAWPAVEFAAAIHPHRAGAYAGSAEGATVASASAAADVSAVAIGEIGLDYHYDLAPPEVQREVFAAQVALAGSRGLPVVIHAREAMADTVAVLRDAVPSVRGVMHCFSGTRDEARLVLDLGFHISLSGIVTFPKAGDLRDLAAYVPEDRLLAETDAPFLAPVPHRGRRNEPAWVVDTMRTLATVRGVDLEVLASTIRRNVSTLIGGSR